MLPEKFWQIVSDSAMLVSQGQVGVYRTILVTILVSEGCLCTIIDFLQDASDLSAILSRMEFTILLQSQSAKALPAQS